MKNRRAAILGICCMMTGLMSSLCLAETETVMTETVQAEAAETETAETETESNNEEVPVSRASVRYAESYQEIYDLLSKIENNYIVYDTADVYEAADTATAESKNAVSTASSEDYSTTNVRTEGVDEGDVIKTDGRYIYHLKDSKELLVTKADGADTQIVSRLTIGFDSGEAADAELPEQVQALIPSGSSNTYVSVKELLLQGENIYLVCGISGSVQTSRSTYRTWYDRTALVQYVMGEDSTLTFAGAAAQDGYYEQVRMKGDAIYLYTTMWPDVADSLEGSSLIVTVGDGSEEIPAESYCLPEKITAAQYLIMTALLSSDVDVMTDAQVFVSGGDNVYVSDDHTYIYNSYYNSSALGISTSGMRTQLASFAMKDGVFEAEASCTIRGEVNNTWSLDAYGGYLRVLTTYTGASLSEVQAALDDAEDMESFLDWADSIQTTRHNAVFILDEALQYVGGLDGIAENESIESARFFGDLAYFVTYENTDPVFCVDLSDPAAPQILSEFETTGFSSYLHPYGDGRLLGIGYETDPDTGDTQGLKLSMFSIEADGSIEETDRTVIRGIWWSPAIEDYKRILVDADKNLIGFYQDDRYLVYRYDEEGGFERVLLFDYLAEDLGGTASAYNARGLYIGDELYIAGNESLVAFDMANDFRQDAGLVF